MPPPADKTSKDLPQDIRKTNRSHTVIAIFIAYKLISYFFTVGRKTSMKLQSLKYLHHSEFASCSLPAQRPWHLAGKCSDGSDFCSGH